MNSMRESPRRPIILKRRKLPFQNSGLDGHVEDEPQTSSAQSFSHGIFIMDHPTMPDTQVVVIPKAADLQSVINALTAKGKERGPQGPNKFILLSGGSSLEDNSCPIFNTLSEAGMCRNSHTLAVGAEGCMHTDFVLDPRKTCMCCFMVFSLHSFVLFSFLFALPDYIHCRSHPYISHSDSEKRNRLWFIR